MDEEKCDYFEDGMDDFEKLVRLRLEQEKIINNLKKLRKEMYIILEQEK